MRRKITRFHLLAGGSATLGAFSIVRSTAKAADFVYKLGHFDSVDSTLNVLMVKMADAIKTETNGRMEIQIFPNYQLGNATSMMTQLRLGSIHFVVLGANDFGNLVPAVNISTLGFIFTSEPEALRTMDGPLGAYINRELDRKGVHVFPKVFNYSLYQLTSSKKPIKTVDDFAGFKIRIRPNPTEVDLFTTLGASPTVVESSQLYTALQTHIVDGQSAALQVIETFKYYEVQKYLSFTNHQWGCPRLAANADAWNALPPEIAAVVNRNADVAVSLQRRAASELDASLRDKLKRRGLIFNNANTAGMRARLQPYYVRQKSDFGSSIWSLLEDAVGKRG